MAGKVEQELLLTPEQRDDIRKNWCKNEIRVFDELIENTAKAQLAQAEPLIRKKTVEEVWQILNDFRKYDPYNIGADTNALKARLEKLGGEGCSLPFNTESEIKV